MCMGRLKRWEVETERWPGGNAWAKQISGAVGVAWAWWVAWREKHLTIQVGALREMQIASSTNSSAKSSCVAENRTKACIPQFRYPCFFLKEKKKKMKMKKKITIQEQIKLGAACKRYPLFSLLQNPWWANEGFIFSPISGSVLICCYSGNIYILKLTYYHFYGSQNLVHR